MKTTLTPAGFVPRIVALVFSAFVLVGPAVAGTEDTVKATKEAGKDAATSAQSASKEAWDATKSTAKSAAASVQDVFNQTWAKVKDSTFKQRIAVQDSMKAALAKIDERITEWNARKDALDVSDDDYKKKVLAAFNEVTESRKVLGQKVDAVDNATEETWTSVKTELNSAWQRMTKAAADLAALLKPPTT